MTHRHSIFCILPPYMLEQIVENGSSEQSALAAQTLAVSQAIREERQSLALATTRGDGLHGEVITANVRTIRSVPLVPGGFNRRSSRGQHGAAGG